MSAVPRPGRALDPLTEILPAGTRLWRNHRLGAAATAFVASERPTRFGPLADPTGRVVPIWYGATTPEGAIHESVFHDVPFDVPDPIVLRAAFQGRALSPIRTRHPIRSVDLTVPGLRRIRARRADLIESDPASYDTTRAWAVALRAADPDAGGMRWVARLDDRAVAVVLFGDRVPDDVLVEDPADGGPIPLGFGAGSGLVETLAERCGITIVVP
ncbi:MAG: RES family NAD+ phosphorylase [Chloroflexota bacterium]